MFPVNAPAKRSESRAAFMLASQAPEIKNAVPAGAARRRRPACRVAAFVPAAVTCQVVRQIVLEMTVLAGDAPRRRRDGRRTACHMRQVAMYVCNVALQISLSDIGAAFGRDRTTVSHACAVVEDRRDDPGFDAFVAAIERVAAAIFGPAGLGAHEGTAGEGQGHE